MQPAKHPTAVTTDQAGRVWLPLLILLALFASLAIWILYPPQAQQLQDVAANLQPLAADDAPSLTAISREDLPPAGTRSLFDHLLAANDGLPYPFAELQALLQRYDAQGRAPSSILIPFSRSLLKGASDLSEPRMVLAADIVAPGSEAELPPMFKGRLFLGFTEGADEIEVISYNPQAGRYEFQLVKDYREGGVPRITYAKRAICISCHTNEATIFPVRPWQETSAQKEVSLAMQEAGAGKRSADGQHYFGAPLSGTLEQAEQIDAMTDIGNSIVTTQRIWLDGCGANLSAQACRAAMLEQALLFAADPGAFDEQSEAVKQLKALQAKGWPTAGIALANPDLANRNPLDSSYERGRPLRERLREQVLSWFQDDTGDFEKQAPLPAELDPLTPRPHKAILKADDLSGVYGLAQLFHPHDMERLQKAAGYDWSKIQTAIQAPGFAPQLDAKPASRIDIMRALLAELGQTDTLPGACCLNTSEMSAPILDGEPPLELAADSTLQPYQDYCFSCHRGNPSARLNFMSGKTEAEVLEKIAATSEIKEALDWERYLGTAKASKLMPPANSWQRRKLDKVRAAGEDPLPEMLEAVPDLFEF